MGVTIAPELEKLPYWQEIRDYVNQQMAEEAWEGLVYVRPLTREEEVQLHGSGRNISVTERESEALELAVSPDKYLDFEEVSTLAPQIGTGTLKSAFMHLWLAQMACMGKSSGRCDS